MFVIFPFMKIYRYKSYFFLMLKKTTEKIINVPSKKYHQEKIFYQIRFLLHNYFPLLLPAGKLFLEKKNTHHCKINGFLILHKIYNMNNL